MPCNAFHKDFRCCVIRSHFSLRNHFLVHLLIRFPKYVTLHHTALTMWRWTESNSRKALLGSSGYEPDEIPLLHTAIYFEQAHGFEPPYVLECTLCPSHLAAFKHRKHFSRILNYKFNP